MGFRILNKPHNLFYISGTNMHIISFQHLLLLNANCVWYEKQYGCKVYICIYYVLHLDYRIMWGICRLNQHITVICPMGVI